MRKRGDGNRYFPGMYSKIRPDGDQFIENYFREMDIRLIEEIKTNNIPGWYPAICCSRKIGAGALEIADIVAQDLHYQKMPYRVIDREILNHIGNSARLSDSTAAYYDERYPGKTSEFLMYLFGEKSFTKNDYSKHLFSSVIAMAGLGPIIFVGRGTHKILPREKTLSVRFNCSDQYRTKRIARIMNIQEKEAARQLEEIDREQEDFFKQIFQTQQHADPAEFDLVINCDTISDPHAAAAIVKAGFKAKFAVTS